MSNLTVNMHYAICIAKQSSIVWWTGKSWSTDLSAAKLFKHSSQAKKKIQQIYYHLDGVASVVFVNSEQPVSTPINVGNTKLDSLGDRIKNLLCRNGLDSDRKVQQTPDYKLWEIKGMGEQSFYKIRSVLPYRRSNKR
jgi:hypothetical protein